MQQQQQQQENKFVMTLNGLLSCIEVAQKRGAYSLEESSVIFKLFQDLKNSEELQEILSKSSGKKEEKKEELVLDV